MQKRRLGTLEVSAVGLGCATMTPFYDQPDSDTAIDTHCAARVRSAWIFSTARMPTVWAATRS